MREITQCTRHVAAWALQGPVLHSGVGSRTSVVATAKRGISMKISSKLVFSSDGNQVLDRGVWKRFKYCHQCNLIMVERAKWSKNFDEVKYCSDTCRRSAKQAAKVVPPEGNND